MGAFANPAWVKALAWGAARVLLLGTLAYVALAPLFGGEKAWENGAVTSDRG
jgi:hypothetical protein